MIYRVSIVMHNSLDIHSLNICCASSLVSPNELMHPNFSLLFFLASAILRVIYSVDFFCDGLKKQVVSLGE